MPAPAADTANLALVRNLPNDPQLLSGVDLNYIANVMRGLASPYAGTFEEGLQLVDGATWNALTAAVTALGSTVVFPEYLPGPREIMGEDFNQVLSEVRALNV